MKKETLDSIRYVFGVVAMVAAGIVLAKVFGMGGRIVAGSVTEWTCVAISCALAGR